MHGQNRSEKRRNGKKYVFERYGSTVDDYFAINIRIYVRVDVAGKEKISWQYRDTKSNTRDNWSISDHPYPLHDRTRLLACVVNRNRSMRLRFTTQASKQKNQ